MARRTVREINEEGRQSAAVIETFMADHLRFTGGPLAGRPFIVTPLQRDRIVQPLFGTLDAKGDRWYSEALLGRARWGGKSQVGSALALSVMYTEPVYEGEYYAVATTKHQAGIVFGKAKRMILADPLLRAISKVYRSVIEIPETGATFQVLPWNADTAQGFHPAVCVIDEYHVHRDPTMREAMLSGMVGARNPLMITISTAGDERKGPLWELLVSSTGKPGPYSGPARHDPHMYVDWIGASDDDDGRDPKVWRRANPGRWVTSPALRKAYQKNPFPVFERYHLNRFPRSGTNRAYPAALWHACASPPAFDPKAPTILALDASWTRDTTALAMVQRDAAALHNVWAQVWRKDAAMGHIDHEAVEVKILELCETYNVIRIACDPNYFTRSMLKLEHEFGLPIEEFPQENKRTSAAAMALFDVLQEKRIAHGGTADLTEHVLNAGVKPTAYGWRLTKTEAELKIDAAVALSMAVYLAEAEGGVYRSSFAETGGVWSIPLG